MTWRKDVLETFAELGTKPDEWKPCDMEFVGNGAYMAMGCVPDRYFTHWHIPEDYTMAWTRFSENDAAINDQVRMNEDGNWEENNHCCHLCGHDPIVNLCYIQHDEKKLWMLVGSSCVENFDIPGIIRKKKRAYIAKAALEEFIPLREKVRRIRENFLKKKKWMPRWLWDADKQFHDRDTTRKQINFIKKYKVLLEEAALQQTYDVWRLGQ